MDLQQKVLIFTTPTCTFCNAAKRYLNEHRIKYKEIDVTRDSAAAKDIQRRTGSMGVPVILINNRPVVGFDKAKINRLLNIR